MVISTECSHTQVQEFLQGGGGPGPTVRKQLIFFSPQHCGFPGGPDLLAIPPLGPCMKAKTISEL